MLYNMYRVMLCYITYVMLCYRRCVMLYMLCYITCVMSFYIAYVMPCDKILPLQSLYYESVCSLMYDVNKNTAPVNISKLFSRISSVHTYNTRASTSEDFYTKESRLNVEVEVEKLKS